MQVYIAITDHDEEEIVDIRTTSRKKRSSERPNRSLQSSDIIIQGFSLDFHKTTTRGIFHIIEYIFLVSGIYQRKTGILFYFIIMINLGPCC